MKDVALPGDLAGLRSFEAQISGMTEYPDCYPSGSRRCGLALGYADLADCRFAGAHDLDKLRLEAGAAFGLSPTPAWDRRQVIAEESAWRAARIRPRRWKRPAWTDFDTHRRH